jgi:hypothetical protein
MKLRRAERRDVFLRKHAKAQDAMYEAWERTTSRSRIALARKALDISPLCADAEGAAPVSMVHGLGP